MYVTVGLWFAVAICALGFAGSGLWQAYDKRALKPALASGSPLVFGLVMVVIAGICFAKGISLAMTT